MTAILPLLHLLLPSYHFPPLPSHSPLHFPHFLSSSSFLRLPSRLLPFPSVYLSLPTPLPFTASHPFPVFIVAPLLASHLLSFLFLSLFVFFLPSFFLCSSHFLSWEVRGEYGMLAVLQQRSRRCLVVFVSVSTSRRALGLLYTAYCIPTDLPSCRSERPCDELLHRLLSAFRA